MGNVTRPLLGIRTPWCGYLTKIAARENPSASVTIVDGSPDSPGEIRIDWTGLPDIDAAALLDAFEANPPADPMEADRQRLAALREKLRIFDFSTITDLARARAVLKDFRDFLVQ